MASSARKKKHSVRVDRIENTYGSTSFVFCDCYGAHRDLHSFPTRRSSDLWPIFGMIGLVSWVALSAITSRLPNAALPYMDSALVTVSLIAQYMMTKKYRSEEHTSELQSRRDFVWRLLLEKKNIPSESTVLKTRTVQQALYFVIATAPTEIYTLSLHDALPISGRSLA